MEKSSSLDSSPWHSRNMSVSADRVAEGPWKTGTSFPPFILICNSHMKDSTPYGQQDSSLSWHAESGFGSLKTSSGPQSAEAGLGCVLLVQSDDGTGPAHW